MVFKITNGDLFSNVTEGLIVHGCNAQGVMGSGVAKIIKEMYPAAYERYAKQHPNYILGEVIPKKVTDDLVIVNAITQDRYGTDKVHADYDAIRQAMKGSIHLARFYKNMLPCNHIHMPLIGGGLAGGDKDTIISIMQEELDPPGDIQATLWLYK